MGTVLFLIKNVLNQAFLKRVEYNIINVILKYKFKG
jgi:hypothetical protein